LIVYIKHVFFSLNLFRASLHGELAIIIKVKVKGHSRHNRTQHWVVVRTRALIIELNCNKILQLDRHNCNSHCYVLEPVRRTSNWPR